MSIRLERLMKAYDEHVVVNRVSLEVDDGECFVLLGPSGSGKSTVLRIVAGLVGADSGRVWLRGRDVTQLPPQRRGVGMVFQHYALFGHMTVGDNVEFALRIRDVGRRERRRRRDELLELVGLVGFQDRFPHQLSGGQQQRVALARALAHRPEVLLLDEPFGALDARIRAELRRVLRRIQREVGVTTIFVTHDQDEAFELGDRMAVMNLGRLLEVGVPRELYLRPQTEFVATFLGRANLFVGVCSSDGVHVGGASFPLASRTGADDDARRVQVLFRPEDVAVKLTRDALDGPAFGEGVVEAAEFSGSIERLRIRIPAIRGVRPIAPAVPFGSDSMLLEATRSQHLARRWPLAVGDRAWVGIRRIHALAHRGLSFAVIDRGPGPNREFLAWTGNLARSCHARVTLLSSRAGTAGPDGRARDARDELGRGLAAVEVRPWDPRDPEASSRELEIHPQDLVLVPERAGDPANPDDLLRTGAHHLLLVPPGARPLRRALVCAAAGEPGKQAIVAAGRILRHLGGAAVVLTALDRDVGELHEQAERFHEAALRTLALYGVEARSELVRGTARDAIRLAIARCDPDLVVLGSPRLAAGEGPSVVTLVRGLLGEPSLPVLIVRHEEESP